MMNFFTSPNHRRKKYYAAIAALTALLIATTALAAEEQAFTFDLPAQPLSATLDSLARSTNVKLIYSDKTTQGLQAEALKGNYTMRQALDKVLSKSGLHPETVDKAVIAINPAHKTEEDSSFTLGTVSVVADESGNGSSGGSLRTRDILTSVDIVNSPDLLEKQNVDYSWGLYKNLPGVEVTNFNQGTSSGKISFRGFNGEGNVNAVKLLIDGIPSNSNDGNMPFMDAIFPMEIDSIELVRGTNDPRYGLNNIAGNTNIRTRQGGNYLKSILSYGSYKTFDMQHYAGYEKDGFAQNYFAGFRTSSGYRQHSDFDRFAFSGKWFYTPEGEKLRTGLIARWYQAPEAQEPGYLTSQQAMVNPTYSNPWSSTDASNRTIGHLSAHLDMDILDNLSWSLKSYGQLYKDQRWVTFSVGTSQQERVSDEVQYGAISNVTYHPEVPFLDDFSVETGVDFQYQDNTSLRYLSTQRIQQTPTRNQQYNFYTYGGYIQSIIRPVSWLKIVPAFRADAIGGDLTNRLNQTTAPIYNYGAIPQPKISMVLTPVEGYNLYGNWGRTFQIGLGSGSYKLNPNFNNLLPSLNDGWETGLKFQPVEWLEGRLAYWEQTATNEVSRKLNDPLGDSVNVGSTKRRGVDAQLSIRPIDPVTIWGAYALQEAKIVQSNIPNTVGKWVDHVPAYLFSGGIDYDITKDMKASLWSNVGGSYYLENTNTTQQYGQYALLNLRLGYQVNKYVDVQFQAKNLTNQYNEYVWWDGVQALHSPADGLAFYGSVNLLLDY